jgi:aerobic-type carbon monoxide dehydrogenase small subunit (CoxS/CutS family)
MPEKRRIVVEINGQEYGREVEARLLLSDFIRHEAGLTGTHVGCEHGVCGACTVQMDGEPVRSCLMFAVQAQGHSLRTVEALNEGMGGELHPLQQAFHECHGLQCGFCTPGFLMSIEPFLPEAADWDERQIREALAGNLCRCTGYQNIVSSVQLAAKRMREGELRPPVSDTAEPIASASEPPADS